MLLQLPPIMHSLCTGSEAPVCGTAWCALQSSSEPVPSERACGRAGAGLPEPPCGVSGLCVQNINKKIMMINKAASVHIRG